jgi:putative PEP-CTERM system TPR-repeat lipoprotein
MKHNKSTINRLTILTLWILINSPAAFAINGDAGLDPNAMQDAISSFYAQPAKEDPLATSDSDFAAIRQMIANQQTSQARSKLQDILIQQPDSVDAHNYLGFLDALENRQDAAKQHFTAALQKDKANPTALTGLAKLELQVGHHKEARNLANRLLALDSNNLTAYYLLVDIANQQKEIKEIERLLTTAFKKMRGNPANEISVAANLGQFYLAQKQPQKFLNLAQELHDRYPQNSKTYSLLALAQSSNKQSLEAEKTLQKLVIMDPKDIYGRLQLATLLIKQADKKQQVTQLLDEIKALSPNDPQMFFQLSNLSTRVQRFDDAMSYAKLVDMAQPQSGLGKVLLGDAYLAQNKLDDALAAYQAAYQAKPNEKISGTIADILSKQGNFPAATEWLENELKNNDKNLATHLRLATLYQQQNQFQQAETHYQAILAVDKENLAVINNLAWLYSLQNKPEALILAEKAYKKAPNSPVIADTFGTILLKAGKVEQSLPILEKAAAQPDETFDIQFHLAQAYSQSNQKAKAIEILKTILKSGQDFSEKTAATKLLNELTQ